MGRSMHRLPNTRSGELPPLQQRPVRKAQHTARMRPAQSPKLRSSRITIDRLQLNRKFLQPREWLAPLTQRVAVGTEDLLEELWFFLKTLSPISSPTTAI